MADNNRMVHNAFKAGLCVPAFNVAYLPMMEPVVRALVDMDAFGLVETACVEWHKFESKGLGPVMEEFKRWEQPEYVGLHLDHVSVIDEDNQTVDYMAILQEAVSLGYHSVMLDGSLLPLEENIAASKQAADLAHSAGIPCEAELGAVLRHGEDTPPYEEIFASGRGFTDVDEAVRFVTETGCDWFSVAFGSIHGAISGALCNQKKVEAKLNLEHLDRLRDATGLPLVLHGGSGVRREYVLEAVKRGIAKVNIGMEIRQAYEQGFRESGSVVAGQEATYERTCWVIRDYFGLAGTRSQVVGE